MVVVGQARMLSWSNKRSSSAANYTATGTRSAPPLIPYAKRLKIVHEPNLIYPILFYQKYDDLHTQGQTKELAP